jgi:hypothetical protein
MASRVWPVRILGGLPLHGGGLARRVRVVLLLLLLLLLLLMVSTVRR